MNHIKEFKHLLEEVNVFKRNLIKDSHERRRNLKGTQLKFKKLDKIRDNYKILKDSFNKSNFDVKIKTEAKDFANSIDKCIEDIKTILEERLQLSQTEQPDTNDLPVLHSDSETSSSGCSDNENMAEKFNLKTAASLLPVMNGSETVTKQLLDAIELYDSMLDSEGKKLLTTYVLKKSLSQNAKIRLNKSYISNEALMNDIKNNFITKKSVSSLSTLLHTAKQGGKTIEQFGKSVEELLVDLTITQAEGNESSIPILRNVNEKIALNVFANGLRSSSLQTIIKARNYSSLSEAIQGAKDEEVSVKSNNDQVFNLQARKNFKPNSSNFSRFSRGHPRMNHNFNNSSRGNSSSYRGHNNRGYSNKKYFNHRDYGNKYSNNSKNAYYMSNPTETVGARDSTNNSNTSDSFFRAPTH